MLRHSLKTETVSVLFDDDQLTLAWIKNETSLPVLAAYKTISWTTREFYQGVVYNIFFVQSCIKDFITTYGICNPRLAVCISGNTINEIFCISPDAKTPSKTPDQSAHNNNQRQCYIGPTQNHDAHWHYTCSFSQEYLFQYLLLGIRIQAPVTVCTTTTMAYISLYKKIHGTSFRQTQLSLDLERHSHKAEQLFSLDIIHKMITTGLYATNMQNEFNKIACALGLFYIGNQIR